VIGYLVVFQSVAKPINSGCVGRYCETIRNRWKGRIWSTIIHERNQISSCWSAE